MGGRVHPPRCPSTTPRTCTVWFRSVAVASARMIIAPLDPAEMTAEATYVYDHVGLGDGHPAGVSRPRRRGVHER